MTRALVIGCIMFCAWAVNLQPSSTSIDKISPHEKFSGTKLDFKRDLRAKFGQWCHATVPNPNNTMAARTECCVAMGSAGNLTGSVRMWCMETNQVLVRDHVILPMSDKIADNITAMARKEGLLRSGTGESFSLSPNIFSSLTPGASAMNQPDGNEVHQRLDNNKVNCLFCQ